MNLVKLNWACKLHGSHPRHYNPEHIFVVHQVLEGEKACLMLLIDGSTDTVTNSIDEINELLPSFRRVECFSETNKLEHALVNTKAILSLAPSHHGEAYSFITFGSMCCLKVNLGLDALIRHLNGGLH